jgi:hypothetical protein
MQPSTMINNVKCLQIACGAQSEQETIESAAQGTNPLRPLVLVAPFSQCWCVLHFIIPVCVYC